MTTANETPKALPCPKCGRMPRLSASGEMLALTCYGAAWFPFFAHMDAVAFSGNRYDVVCEVIARWNRAVIDANRLREALKP